MKCTIQKYFQNDFKITNQKVGLEKCTHKKLCKRKSDTCYPIRNTGKRQVALYLHKDILGNINTDIMQRGIIKKRDISACVCVCACVSVCVCPCIRAYVLGCVLVYNQYPYIQIPTQGRPPLPITFTDIRGYQKESVCKVITLV